MVSRFPMEVSFRFYCFLLLFAVFFSLHICVVGSVQREFVIQGDEFIKDGSPFRIISGSMHCWRSKPSDWRKRMEMAKLMGLNTITTYFNWAMHEKQPGQFDFSGDLDIVKYIQTADELGLLVIARVGPYITAEVDFGGFPYWLANVSGGMELRTTDPTFLYYVDRYWDQLIPLLAPLQYSRGGPIIDFQIEDDTDTKIPSEKVKPYYSYLRDGLRKRDIDVLINTLTFPFPSQVKTAVTEGTWLALEFTYWTPPRIAFDIMRHFYPTGPLMVLEYYPAWFDQESLPHQTLSATVFAEAVDHLLSLNASLNIYPVFGGTNFGFSNGAQHPYLNNEYRAVIASYDFDAPINEAGDPTTKFIALRDVIKKYVPVPADPVPGPSAKGAYGIVEMREYAPLFASLDLFGKVHSSMPIPMESLGYGYGYVLYTTIIESFTEHLSELAIHTVQDRALVYIDGVYEGELGWAVHGTPSSIPIKPIHAENISARLDILVENKGRPSGEVQNFDFAHKGINGQVTINGKPLSGNWTHTLLPMTDLASIHFHWLPYDSRLSSSNFPSFYRGSFNISSTPALHTFLLVEGWDISDTWGHGFVLINGFNIGRFSILGPQRTLYVPASLLHPGINEVIVFESDLPSNTNTRLPAAQKEEVYGRKASSFNYRIMSSVGEQMWY